MPIEQRTFEDVRPLNMSATGFGEGGTEVVRGLHFENFDLDDRNVPTALTSLTLLTIVGVYSWHRIATRVRPGIISLSSCSRFAPSLEAIVEGPVMLPPGCARLVTNRSQSDQMMRRQ